MTKLKPLFKKNQKQAPQNYRHITLSLLFFKIIEEGIYDKKSFLDKNTIVYTYLPGFKNFFSLIDISLV